MTAVNFILIHFIHLMPAPWLIMMTFIRNNQRQVPSIYLLLAHIPLQSVFMENSGDEIMQLYWSGPGMERQLVPDAAFRQVSGTPELCSASGSILHEIWQNAAGDAVTNIPQDRLPDIVNQVSSLETSSLGDIYGERMRGYICPPISGNYVFMISGDDHVQLWLSSDGNPGNKTLIAYMNDWGDFRQFNKYTSQISATVSLVAGQRYYIEVLHKQGYGPNHLTVGWQLPTGQRKFL
jgi:hypothetical protein